MNEKPILFSGPMVTAILERRKKMTRRVFSKRLVFNENPDRYKSHGLDDDGRALFEDLQDKDVPWIAPVNCPYGRVGDLLWVREAFCHFGNCYSQGRSSALVRYLADDSFREIEHSDLPDYQSTHEYWRKNRPSIHMPRWASRLRLRITDVRVERVQSISANDVVREGVLPAEWQPKNGDNSDTGFAIHEFSKAWDQINGKKAPWASNPFVWCVSFEVVK